MTQDFEDDERRGDNELLQLVTFTINNEEYGVEILKVQEIIRTMEITRVPRAPAFVEGVINLRGKVIPIIDLRRRFSLPSRPHDKDTRIIVIDVNGTVLGFISDAVSQVLRIPADTVEPAPPVINGTEAEYVSGVGRLDNRLLIMLDLNKLLSPEDLENLRQI